MTTTHHRAPVVRGRTARSIAIALALGATCSLAGCGNWVDSPIGGVMVTADAGGGPVLGLRPCGQTPATVEMFRLNTEDREAVDPVVGRWTTDEDDRDRLAIGEPTGWRVAKDPGPLDPDAEYVVEMTYRDESTMGSSSTMFRPRDLTSLGKDRVVANGDGAVMSVKEFDDWACRP